jgi:hypothetical protein
MVYKDPEYSKKYYRNVLKEKMENQISYCDVCKKELRGWNVAKHFKYSKKHHNLCCQEGKMDLK